MAHARVDFLLRANAALAETLDIRRLFIAQRINLRCHDEGRGKVREVVCSERRNIRRLRIARIAHIESMEPAHILGCDRSPGR